MNFFVLWRTPSGRTELVTAPLDGTILPGVTRQSILDLARSWGEVDVSERKFNMVELAAAVREGRVLEAFGAGTAAVVSPVKMVRYNGVDYHIPLDPADPGAGAGPLARRMWAALGDIQYGRTPHEWSVKIA
jgi:branched-chain amino acid aminotransferase